MANDALALSGLDAFYDDSHVLHGVSLQLGEGRLLGLTVRENLAVAARRPRDGRPAPWTFDTVYGCSRGCASGTGRSPARSGGEQQMLAIGRALMSNPRVLLMDEPSEGLAPQTVAEVMATIRRPAS